MDAKVDKTGKCPVMHGTTSMSMRSNSDWWPNQLNLRILHQNSALSDPLGKDFDYAKATAGGGPCPSWHCPARS